MNFSFGSLVLFSSISYVCGEYYLRFKTYLTADKITVFEDWRISAQNVVTTGDKSSARISHVDETFYCSLFCRARYIY